MNSKRLAAELKKIAKELSSSIAWEGKTPQEAEDMLVDVVTTSVGHTAIDSLDSAREAIAQALIAVNSVQFEMQESGVAEGKELVEMRDLKDAVVKASVAVDRARTVAVNVRNRWR